MPGTAPIFRPFRCAQETPGESFNRDALVAILRIGDAADNAAIRQINSIAVARRGFEPNHRPHAEEPGMAGANVFENGPIIPLGLDQHAFAAAPITKAGAGYVHASEPKL